MIYIVHRPDIEVEVSRSSRPALWLSVRDNESPHRPSTEGADIKLSVAEALKLAAELIVAIDEIESQEKGRE